MKLCAKEWTNMSLLIRKSVSIQIQTLWSFVNFRNKNLIDSNVYFIANLIPKGKGRHMELSFNVNYYFVLYLRINL